MENTEKKTVSWRLRECPPGFEIECSLLRGKARLVSVTEDTITIEQASRDIAPSKRKKIKLDSMGRIKNLAGGSCVISPEKYDSWELFRFWKHEKMFTDPSDGSRYWILNKKESEYFPGNEGYEVVRIKDGYTYLMSEVIPLSEQMKYKVPEHIFEPGDYINKFSEGMLKITGIEGDKYIFEDGTSRKISSVDVWEYLWWFGIRPGDSYTKTGLMVGVKTADGKERFIVYGTQVRVRRSPNFTADTDIIAQFSVNPDGSLSDKYNFSLYDGYRLLNEEEKEIVRSALKRENKQISSEGTVEYAGSVKVKSHSYGNLTDITITGIENDKAEEIENAIKSIL